MRADLSEIYFSYAFLLPDSLFKVAINKLCLQWQW